MILSSKKCVIFYAVSTLLLLFVQNSESCKCRNFYHPQAMKLSNNFILLVNIIGFNKSQEGASFFATIQKIIQDDEKKFVINSTAEIFLEEPCYYREGTNIISGIFNGYPMHQPCDIQIENPTLQQIENMEKMLISPCKVRGLWGSYIDKKEACEMSQDGHSHMCQYLYSICESINNECQWSKSQEFDTCMEEKPIENIDNPQEDSTAVAYYTKTRKMCSVNEKYPIWACRKRYDICQERNGSYSWSNSEIFQECIENKNIEYSQDAKEYFTTESYRPEIKMCPINQDYLFRACQEKFDTCKEENGSYSWSNSQKFLDCVSEIQQGLDTKSEETEDSEEDSATDYPDVNLCSTDEDYKIWTCRKRFDTCEEQNGSFSWSNSYEFQHCVNEILEDQNRDTDVTHVKIKATKITHIKSETTYT